MGVIVGLLFGLVALVVITLVGAAILSLATSLAGIEGRTFGKAVTATVGAAVAGFVVGIPLSILGVDGGLHPPGRYRSLNSRRNSRIGQNIATIGELTGDDLAYLDIGGNANTRTARAALVTPTGATNVPTCPLV